MIGLQSSLVRDLISYGAASINSADYSPFPSSRRVPAILPGRRLSEADSERPISRHKTFGYDRHISQQISLPSQTHSANACAVH